MNYCTYAYLREDGTPYYIGKGLKHRPYQKNRLFKPPTKDRILILKTNLTEEEAFRHEIYMIAVFGRKDNGTGILRNRTDGGEGISGYKHDPKTKIRIGLSNSSKTRSKELREKIANSVKGFKWYNNGLESMQARVHPGKGWTEGRILSWPSTRSKNMRWYHRNGEQKMFAENPGEGWVLGMKSRSTQNNHTNQGKKWYNNGEINKMFVDPPADWTLGMLRK